MSVNRQVPHVLVLPEDDANRQLANGFQLDALLATRRMQILEEAGGWHEVLNRFKSDHVREMERNANRFMVLLIDFDKQGGRLENIRAEIPSHLKERVFILGVWSEPEELRQECGESYETIGLTMAKDCRDNTELIWTHGLLSHNADELERLRKHIRPILFP
ncbi:MAG: hypothetical protein ACLPRE_05420 [Limisphaerales bacterium]